MNRNYIYLTVLMLLLAAGTIIFTNENEPEQIEPEELLQEMVQPTRYISTDEVAELIIHGDPNLMLVDVRPELEYQEFALPGSLNIPLETIVEEANISYFGIPGIDYVFVSNDDIAADQAWVLMKRLGFESTYVMKGGLNAWMETIIDPQEPRDVDGNAAQELYSFRKGAQQYFTGSGNVETETSKVTIDVQRRKKTEVASGGC